MRLLLFGGTFDPPHAGHMDLLRGAIAAAKPDKVLIIPTAVPPHKAGSTTPAPLRLAMCACFKAVFKNLEVSDLELHRGGKSYTVTTVRQVARLYPGAQLFFSIGGDMLLIFQQWYHYKELLRLATLVVQDRGENRAALEETAEALRAEGGRILFAKGATTPISSTAIREGIAAGQAGFFRYIPPPADEIVRQNNLYHTGDAKA